MGKSILLRHYYILVAYFLGVLFYYVSNPILTDLISFYAPNKSVKYFLLLILHFIGFLILIKAIRKYTGFLNIIKQLDATEK